MQTMLKAKNQELQKSIQELIEMRYSQCNLSGTFIFQKANIRINVKLLYKVNNACCLAL